MKRFGFIAVATFGAIFLLLLSCSEQRQSTEKATPAKAKVENLATTPQDIKKEAQDLANTTLAYTEEQKAIYREKIQEKLDQYSKKLEDLETKMVMLNEQAKASLVAEMEYLNSQKQKADEKIKELGSASDKAYEDLKKGLDRSLEEMDQAYEEAMAHFSK